MMHKYRIILEVWGADEQDAFERAGNYLSIGYEHRIVTSVEILEKDEEDQTKGTYE